MSNANLLRIAALIVVFLIDTQVASSQQVEFLFSFDTPPGSGNGEFNQVRGIAVDVAGNIFLGDTNNHRVQVFDSLGAYKNQFGSVGVGSGQFDRPFDLDIDNQGNIYVAEHNNGRVQLFDSSTNHISHIGMSVPGSMETPRSIAVSSTGEVYVGGNNHVYAFDNAGVFQFHVGGEGVGDGQIAVPHGIAIAESGDFYVVERENSRVSVFDRQGSFKFKFGSNGTGVGEFQAPIGIAIDKTNLLYISDAANNRIQMFDTSGSYKGEFGRQGSANGEFQFPTSIAFADNGNLYIVDSGNSRVQVFRSIPEPGSCSLTLIGLVAIPIFWRRGFDSGVSRRRLRTGA